MRIFLFMFIFLTVFALISLYISKRFVKKFDTSLKVKRYFNIFLVVNYFGIVGYIASRYTLDVPSWLYFLFSMSIGVLFLLFCTAIIYDISRVIIAKSPISNDRRRFFKRTLDVGAIGVATALSARAVYEARFVEIQKVDIKLKNLNKPYKIVQLSDVHIGGLIDAKFIADIVKRVNALKPDVVVITGDLIDVKLDKAKDSLDELKGFESTYGTYFIVGNHEYFHGVESIIQKVNSLGIKVLENENVYIGEQDNGFNLAGVYDLFGYRIDKFKPDLNKALENKKDAPTVLLSHQPRYMEEIKDEVDLVLSGHTHGGQLYPFRFLVKLQQKYVSGLYQHSPSTQIYVNKGTGFWGPPMRLGATSEISEITIS